MSTAHVRRVFKRREIFIRVVLNFLIAPGDELLTGRPFRSIRILPRNEFASRKISQCYEMKGNVDDNSPGCDGSAGVTSCFTGKRRRRWFFAFLFSTFHKSAWRKRVLANGRAITTSRSTTNIVRCPGRSFDFPVSRDTSRKIGVEQNRKGRDERKTKKGEKQKIVLQSRRDTFHDATRFFNLVRTCDTHLWQMFTQIPMRLSSFSFVPFNLSAAGLKESLPVFHVPFSPLVLFLRSIRLFLL